MISKSRCLDVSRLATSDARKRQQKGDVADGGAGSYIYMLVAGGG